MKIKHTLQALLIGGSILSGVIQGNAQSITTTQTTNTAGTISEFGPDALVIRTESAAAPVRYSYTEKTTYTDEAGVAVSRDVIKSGAPVTVYYVLDGDRMVASRVVLGKPVAIVPDKIIEKKTTTTTTETE